MVASISTDKRSEPTLLTLEAISGSHEHKIVGSAGEPGKRSRGGSGMLLKISFVGQLQNSTSTTKITKLGRNLRNTRVRPGCKL